jgi:Tol biopolymer transport system component
MDQNGGNLVQLTANMAYETDPAPSPDCSRIAFVSNAHGPFHYT